MMTPREAAAAALWLARTGVSIPSGMCDHYVASYYGLTYSGFFSAEQHYYQTPSTFKHGFTTPPVGACCYWTNGGEGHTALSVGNGAIASTDFPVMGRIGIVPLGAITANWGLTYRGWTDAWYGPQGAVLVDPPTPPSPPFPIPTVLEDEMTRIFTYKAPGHVRADYSSSIEAGLPVVRWIVDPEHQLGLRMMGATIVPWTDAQAASVMAFIVGPMPPAGP